jgi:membrane protease YdiL (CAAX protease family)
MLSMRSNVLFKIATSTAFAALLWFVIFVLKPLNFWLSMCCGIILLFIMAALFDADLLKISKMKPRYIILGILSAGILYGVFYLGNYISAFIIPAKDVQIASVYMNRNGTNPYVIGLALLLIIGPGEEIFWRRFIQKTLTEKYGIKSVAITAVLYAAVHTVTLNFMLIMASLVCGLFWGALYYKEKSLYPVMISHALWDITIFLLLPFK